MLLSERRQRIGDHLAGTFVVKAYVMSTDKHFTARLIYVKVYIVELT
jgi:uncharacterized RDD family membrane protein YckC